MSIKCRVQYACGRFRARKRKMMAAESHNGIFAGIFVP